MGLTLDVSNESYRGKFDPYVRLSDGAAAHLWTTMTGVTQRSPTRKHCQRAGLFLHIPIDPPSSACLLGLCTKSGPCVLLPW